MKNQGELKHGQREWLKFLVVGSLIAVSILICFHPRAGAQSASAAPKAGNVENGKKLYLANRCWECHDYEGQGGAGPRIGPPAIPLSAATTYIRAPKGAMPPYIAKVVSDSEVADIYAWLQSIPKPKDAKSIPLLNY